MIVIVDRNNSEVYFVSEGFRKMSFEKAASILNTNPDEVISVVTTNSISAGQLSSSFLSGKDSFKNTENIDIKPTISQDISSGKGKYLIPARAAAIVVSGIDPPIKFDNGYDYKSVDTIRSSYGGEIPHPLQRLIDIGKIKVIDYSDVSAVEEKKKEHVRVAQRKHKNGGRKIDSDEYGGSDMDSDLEDDRLLRKATRINL